MWTTWLSRERLATESAAKALLKQLQMKQSRGVRGDVHARSLRKMWRRDDCTTRTGFVVVSAVEESATSTGGDGEERLSANSNNGNRFGRLAGLVMIRAPLPFEKR